MRAMGNDGWVETVEQRRLREQIAHKNTIDYLFERVATYMEYLAKDADNPESADGFHKVRDKLRTLCQVAHVHEDAALKTAV